MGFRIACLMPDGKKLYLDKKMGSCSADGGVWESRMSCENVLMTIGNSKNHAVKLQCNGQLWIEEVAEKAAKKEPKKEPAATVVADAVPAAETWDPTAETWDIPEIEEKAGKQEPEYKCLLPDDPFLAQVLSMAELVSSAEDVRKAAMRDQSLADQQEEDILHYVETHRLNAAESCKVVRLLRDVRIRRRIAKNRYMVASEVLRRMTGSQGEALECLVRGVRKKNYSQKTSILKENGIEF